VELRCNTTPQQEEEGNDSYAAIAFFFVISCVAQRRRRRRRCQRQRCHHLLLLLLFLQHKEEKEGDGNIAVVAFFRTAPLQRSVAFFAMLCSSTRANIAKRNVSCGATLLRSSTNKQTK
jgi:hypothetical protein